MFLERFSKRFLIQLFCFLLVFCLFLPSIPVFALETQSTGYTPSQLSSFFSSGNFLSSSVAGYNQGGVPGKIQCNGNLRTYINNCSYDNSRWITNYKSGYNSVLVHGKDIPWMEQRLPFSNISDVSCNSSGDIILFTSLSGPNKPNGSANSDRAYRLGYVATKIPASKADYTELVYSYKQTSSNELSLSGAHFVNNGSLIASMARVGGPHPSGGVYYFQPYGTIGAGSSFARDCNPKRIVAVGGLWCHYFADNNMINIAYGQTPSFKNTNQGTAAQYMRSPEIINLGGKVTGAILDSGGYYLDTKNGPYLCPSSEISKLRLFPMRTTSGDYYACIWYGNICSYYKLQGNTFVKTGSCSTNLSAYSNGSASNPGYYLIAGNIALLADRESTVADVVYTNPSNTSNLTSRTVNFPFANTWVGLIYHGNMYYLFGKDGRYLSSSDGITWSGYGGGSPNINHSGIYYCRALDSDTYEFIVHGLSVDSPSSIVTESLEKKYIISKVKNYPSSEYQWYVSELHDYTGASEVVTYYDFKDDTFGNLVKTQTYTSTGYDTVYANGTTSTTVVNSDGSSTTVQNNPDGTITNIETDAEGNSVGTTEELDGTITTVTTQNGVTETKQVHPDGSISSIEIDEDGNKTTVNISISGDKTTVIEGVDGSTTTIVEVMGSPKVATKIEVDGTQSVTTMDASTTTTAITKPDGTSINISENGDEKTTVTRKPDGTVITKVEKTGEPTVTTEVSVDQVKTTTENLDGSIVIVIEPLNGEKVIIEILPDGTKRTTTEHADGTATVIVESPDGSIETISVAVDGSSTSVITHADGSSGTSTESVDGIKVTNESDLDGTSRVITSDTNSGEKTIIETKPDGSSSKKEIHADGDLYEESVDALGNKTHFHKDKHGNKETTLLDISGEETTIKEDTHGNKHTHKKFGDGSFTQEDLDSEGNKETKHTRVDGSIRLEKVSSDGSKLVSEVNSTGTEVFRKEIDTSGNKKEMSFDETTNVSTTEYDNTFNVTVIDTNDGSKVSIISLNGSDFISAVVDEDSHKITITESDSSGNPLSTANTVEVYYEFSVNEFTMTYDVVALEVTNLESDLAACLPNIVLSILSRDSSNLKCIHLNYSGLDIPEVAFLKGVTMPSLSFTKVESNSFVDMLKDLYLGDDLGTNQAAQEQLLSLDVNEDMKLDIADVAELLAE